MVAKKTDPITSFRVYTNYVKAVRYILASEYGTGSDLLPGVADELERREPYIKLQRRRIARMDRFSALLRNAWQTELALNLPRILENQEFQALSIQWATIQAYYAIYSASCAWLETLQGSSAPNNHQAVLNTLAEWATTRPLFPIPWGAACVSYTGTPDFAGALANYQRSPVNVLLGSPTYESARDFLCTALRRTREDEQTEAVQEWKRRNQKKRIPLKERGLIDERQSPTTLFNFLRRVRVRANYVDPSLFLVGEQYAADAARFLLALSRITAASLLVFEKLCVQTYGREVVAKLAQQFFASSSLARHTLARRTSYW